MPKKEPASPDKSAHGKSISKFSTIADASSPIKPNANLTISSKKQAKLICPDAKTLLGPHPGPPHIFSEYLSAIDGFTEQQVAHRRLNENPQKQEEAITQIRQYVINHHCSPEAMIRAQREQKILERQGLGRQRLRRFPADENTQRGNLAEVVLAEYITAASPAGLPIYRLRYNTNVDQSMKGDDVLAFDLDADPVRVIVGEAKFRTRSDVQTVKDIVKALANSYKSGIPISLNFVAERLFENGHDDLGKRVFDCALLFAKNRLRIDYVGLMLSDIASHWRVHNYTDKDPGLHRLVMISLGMQDPNALGKCYEGLD